jgi:exopolysaccharide biosynthesis polyprenyl glycosylphosphotransferase
VADASSDLRARLRASTRAPARSPALERAYEAPAHDLAPSGEGPGPASKRFGGRRGYVVRRLLAISDVIALIAAFAVMVATRAILDRGPLVPYELELFALMLPVWVALATVLKTYHVGERSLDYSFSDEIGPVFLVATVWNWALLLGTAATTSGSVEVQPAVTIWVASMILVLGMRAAVIVLARRTKWYRQRVVVIGEPDDAARVVRRIDRHPEYGLDLVGTAALGSRQGESELPDLIRFAEAQGASRAIVATTPTSFEERSELIRGLTEAQLQVDIISGEPDLCSSSAAALHYVEGLPVLTVPSVQAPVSWLAVKRTIDIFASFVGLTLLAPVLLLVALAVKLDSRGPVIFRQQRIGRGGDAFDLLKFRTMVDGADELKDSMSDLNMHSASDRRMFKVQADPRITRIGAILRRWSLDELPQLWNVFRGDMSLVGPRPLVLNESKLVEGRYEVRLRMRPGITGPWQTLGRSDIGFEDMIKLDYTYVMNWTLAEDLKLMMRTLGAVVRARGAY